MTSEEKWGGVSTEDYKPCVKRYMFCYSIRTQDKYSRQYFRETFLHKIFAGKRWSRFFVHVKTECIKDMQFVGLIS